MRVNKTVLLNWQEFFLKLLEVRIRLINREGSQRRRVLTLRSPQMSYKTREDFQDRASGSAA
jgi:hypothetical protein